MGIRASYFEDLGDTYGRQLKPFPKKWMDASRFKPGDRIEYLEAHPVCGPIKNRKGAVGVVVEVRNGSDRPFPSRCVRDEGETLWVTQSTGWLVVRFDGDHTYGLEADGRTSKPMACRLEEEGRSWRRAK